jgi:cobalt-zinc-cadmium efflux system outer membrane protein
MFKNKVIVLTFWLAAISAYSQEFDFNQFLQTIEQNNSQLKALRSAQETDLLRQKGLNQLSPLSISGYYLPFGDHLSGDYWEYEISQTFDFPSVYIARSQWAKRYQEKLSLDYKVERQNLLLEAEHLVIHWIYLQKLQTHVFERVEQSKVVYGQLQSLFKEGEEGILALNKAKVIWMGEQFKLSKLQNEQRDIVQSIKSLNGGLNLSLDAQEYPNVLVSLPADSLWQLCLEQDPELINSAKEIELALAGMRLARQKILPNITAGYNYQGIAGSDYSGFYAGLSLPLWQSKTKIKEAQAQLQYSEYNQDVLLREQEARFKQKLLTYELMLLQYKGYQDAIMGLQSELLIYNSYKEGDLSFIEYYSEISFFREAEHEFFEMEKDLQLLMADLLKHRL